MRRAQVTLFVIIGLAILIIGGVLLFVFNDTEQDADTTEEVQLVTTVMQQCLSRTGEEAVRTVSGTGGYLDLGALKDVPTKESQVISLPAERIAMWHEVSSCGHPYGCQHDNRPPLCASTPCPLQAVGSDSIQEGIERYIEEHAPECVEELTAFPQLTVDAGKPDVRATIRENDIALIMEYPLSVEAEGQEFDIDTFTAQLDVRLPALYRFASTIQRTEQQTHFLENIFLHLLSIYAGIDQPLPPMGRDISIDGDRKMWVTRNVQDTIERGILPSLDFIQIINARNYVPIVSPDVNASDAVYANGIYEYMSLKVGNETLPYDVRFEYPRTPMYLDINGKQLLKPRSMPDSGVLKLLGIDILEYRFRYSAAFPVVVRIDDPDAFDGRGLTFNIGLEANVRNNEPLNVSVTPVVMDFAQTSVDLSDPRQLVNHTYVVTVKDLRSDKPLRDAQIIYSCGVEHSLGLTDAQGRWEGKLPYCFSGGYLSAEKHQFAGSATAQLNPSDDGASSSVTLGLWPIAVKDVRVYKITGLAGQQIIAGGDRTALRSPLQQQDTVVLNIARQKSTPFDEDVPFIPTYRIGGPVPQAQSIDDLRAALDEQLRNGTINRTKYDEIMAIAQDINFTPDSTFVSTVALEVVPGLYDISGTLIYAGNISIPEERRREGNVFSGQSYTLPGKNFSTWPSGGVILNGTDGMRLEPDDVYGDKNITIYILEMSFIKDATFFCTQDVCSDGVCTAAERAAVGCRTEKQIDSFCDAGQDPAACVQQYKATHAVQMRHKYETPYPEEWDDLTKYQPIEDYQTYDRRRLVKVEIS